MDESSADRIVADLGAWVRDAPAGARLPPTRELAIRFGAGPVTVQRAVSRLRGLGLVESRPGVGTFVRRPGPAAPPDYAWQTAPLGARPARVTGLSATQRPARPDAIALHSGYPSADLLPGRLVSAALARAARGAHATSRAPAGGLPDLQAWFAGQAGAAAREAIVVPGSQSGLGSVLRAVVGEGRPLVVESPTYWGAILAATQAGIRLVPVPSGPDGPDADQVEHALVTSGARAFYAQPGFANPTGGQWPEQTGQAVLDVVRRRGAFLVEDDWAHDLGLDAEPRPLVHQDDDGHVVYLRTLTKSVSPTLRVAAVVARGPARERILADQAAEAMYVSPVLQAAALDVVTRSAWTTHLRWMREQLRGRRDLLLRHLAVDAPDVHVERAPVGGLNVWARLPDGVDPDRLARECEAEGLLVAAGTEWFPAEPSAGHVRLNPAGEDPVRFGEAAAILGRTVASLRP